MIPTSNRNEIIFCILTLNVIDISWYDTKYNIVLDASALKCTGTGVDEHVSQVESEILSFVIHT